MRAVRRRDQHFRLDAVAAEDRHRHALRLLEHGGEQVGRFDRLAAAAARVVQRQLEDELGRGRHAKIAPGERRHHVQVLFDAPEESSCGFSSMSRITSAEHVPFDLSERQEQVFVRQQRMLAAARFFDGSVDDALSRFADLAR